MNFTDYVTSAIAHKHIDASQSSDPALIAAAMRAILDDEAKALQSDQSVALVSMTFDQLNGAEPDQSVRFETRLDRKTRTLIFFSGTALSGDLGVLKATAIYRIS